MIFYDEYSDVPKEIIERFVTDQQLKWTPLFGPRG